MSKGIMLNLLASTIAMTGLRFARSQNGINRPLRRFGEEDVNRMAKANERRRKRAQKRLIVQARNQPEPPEGGLAHVNEAEDQMAARPDA